VGWRERAGKRFKIFFSPVSAFAGEKKLHCAVQNGTVQFFFFIFLLFFIEEKKKNLGVTQKWVMTILMGRCQNNFLKIKNIILIHFQVQITLKNYHYLISKHILSSAVEPVFCKKKN
jgi:hypothetical protein